MATGLGDEIGWWCPSLDDDGNGTTTLNDLSGNGRNGTLTNMDAATDWVADTDEGGVRALQLVSAGTDEHVNIGDNNAFSFGDSSNDSPFSVSAWVKMFAGNMILLCKYDDHSPLIAEWFVMFGSTRKLALQVTDGSTSIRARRDATNSAAQDTWMHAVATYDGSGVDEGINLYLDDSLIAMTDKSQDGSYVAMDNTAASLRLGISLIDSAFKTESDGRIDDFRLFDRVITASEITHLASARGVLGDGPPSSFNPAWAIRSQAQLIG